MDIAIGNVLVGTISGTLNGGATLETGVIGQALSTNGNQFVDFGKHQDECYYNPRVCSIGVTFSLWIYTRAPSVIFDTGGLFTEAAGFAIQLHDDGVMKISVKSKSFYEYYEVPDWKLYEWTHVVTTWGPGQEIRLYIEGCDVDVTGEKGYYSSRGRTFGISRNLRFLVGRKDTTNRFSNMNLDELHIWHDILSPIQVWQLYLQGGRSAMWRMVLISTWRFEIPTFLKLNLQNKCHRQIGFNYIRIHRKWCWNLNISREQSPHHS